MKPINSQIQIEPETIDEFMVSVKAKYDEIGRVVAVPEEVKVIKPGDRVFFDSWQASKFPKDDKGNFFWFVPFDSIKAYESLS